MHNTISQSARNYINLCISEEMNLYNVFIPGKKFFATKFICGIYICYDSIEETYKNY